MAAWEAFKAILATPEPPELGPGPRAGVLAAPALNRDLEDLFRRTKLPAEKQPLVRALVLLWHDHLDPAHEIAQGVANADGAFLHGIMHRREPDYGNAKYWFHRVGRHAAFPEIARAVAALLKAPHKEQRSQLLPNGDWDPFAFIDACERCARRPPGDAEHQLLRDVQRIEMETLLAAFLSSDPGTQ